MNPDILKVLYSQDDIHAITTRLGAELKRDYAGKNPLVVCILKGAIMFMTDLVREIDDYMELDFMDVSSYGDATESSGEVKIIKDLDASVKDRDVLIVEDIVDTGRICALMDKPEGRVVDVQADYVGTTVPNEFVVGYGLDYAERYRNLPYIGVLKPEVYAAKS